MGPVAGRWWRWLRGQGPLEILPGRPLPAAAAWLLALALTWAADLSSPAGPAMPHAPLVLAVEAGLMAAVLAAARRRHLLAQALQAGGLLAGLRNLILAPVLALLFAADADAGPGTLLVLFVPVALVTVAAMAWVVARYLALWKQALRASPGVAGALLLGMALALLLAEALLGGMAPDAGVQMTRTAAVAAALR